MSHFAGSCMITLNPISSRAETIKRPAYQKLTVNEPKW